MNAPDQLSRRSLIKLLALAGTTISRSVFLLASEDSGHAAGNDSAPPIDGHPRLFYNASALSRIEQMLAADPAAHKALIDHGHELLSASLIPEDIAMRGGGQHANYGAPGNQIAEMGLTLGLLYQLTKEKQYAAKLKEALLYYAQYARWAGQGLAQRNPQWHSELNTARFSFGYSSGYDALHEFLSETERKTVAEAMLRLAVFPILNDWVLPSKRIHSFDSMGHNWWGVCVAGAGLCALSLLGDEPRSQGWLDAIDAGFAQWFKYSGNVLQNRVPNFERSGPSYEGVNYTNYGVSEYLHYRLAWQNTFPNRKPGRIEQLEHLAHYFLHTLYPTSNGSLSVNFNDSSLEIDSSATVLLIIACGFGTPEASRYLELVHTHPESTLLSLLRQYPRPSAQLTLANSCIYPEMGWAMLRSSWENDATLLALKSGFTWNHAHADAGTFVLFKQGAPLVIDSGTCAYNRKEYNTYYRHSRAHNVVLFNGMGQPEEDINSGCKFPGHLHSLIDGLGLKYVLADATGPMAQWFTRNYRHWFWSGDLILIVDDLRAHTAGQMDWLLHYAGQSTAHPQGGVLLENAAAKAVVKMLYPETKLKQENGLADHHPDTKVPYLVFSAEAAARSRQFITAICLNPDQLPNFEVLQAQDYLGVRVKTQNQVEELYLNLRAISSPGTIAIRVGEWLTDAYLVHFKRSAAGESPMERFFVGCGSYLRRGNQSILESLSKVTACWSSGDSLDLFSDDASPSIQIAAERSPKSVRWNGRSLTPKYDPDIKLVLLQL